MKAVDQLKVWKMTKLNLTAPAAQCKPNVSVIAGSDSLWQPPIRNLY